jgi:hypothetical protein
MRSLRNDRQKGREAMQHRERPNPSRFPVLRDLLESADRLLSEGQMLPELEAKAYFDRACYTEAKLRGLPMPPSALEVVKDGSAWFYNRVEIDDAGRRTFQTDADGKQIPIWVPDFLFWKELMDRNGPWVAVIGVEEDHKIADLIAFDPTFVGKIRPPKGEPQDQRRTVCMKALYPVSKAEEADPYAEEQQQESAEDALQRFKHTIKSLSFRKTMAFSPHDMSSPAMTEPAEVFQEAVQQLRIERGGVNLDGFFEGAGAAK